MDYQRNAWYVAGFGDEVPPQGPVLARQLLDEPVVFFRDTAGTLHALHDRCPHRFAPLSAGKLCGDTIECGYHGLRFDGQGQCRFNPHGDGTIPKAAQVKGYAVQERDGIIWFWPGDPTRADSSRIPDYAFAPAAHPDGTVRGYMPTACDYQFLVDNILDLTHADYLHAASLGAGVLSRVRPTVEDIDERTLKIAWYASGELAPPAFDAMLREHGRPTDQWTEVTWTAPSALLLRVGATLQGEPRENGMESLALHLATPESDGRCHYWYWTTRNAALNPESNAFVAQLLRNAFENEDKPMLEAQQRRVGNQSWASLNPVLLPGDAGATRARGKLAALIRAEVGSILSTARRIAECD